MAGNSVKKGNGECVSGSLVVLLLLAAFGYGIYHVFNVESAPPSIRMSPVNPVEENLERLYAAAQVFFAETSPAFATYEDLVGPDRLIPKLESISGESYEGIVIDRAALEVEVLLPDGLPISYGATAAERDGLREQAQDPEARQRLLRRLAGQAAEESQL